MPPRQGIVRDGFGRLVLGDVIVGMNGRPVKKEADLFGELAGFVLAVLLCCNVPASWASKLSGECGCLVARREQHTPCFACCCAWRPRPCSSPPILFRSPSRPAATDILDGCKVGDTVQVEVLRRGGQRKVLSVQLAERQPENTE